MNFNWFYNEGDLTMLCDSSGAINCENFGFTTDGVRWAVANGYQKADENGIMISMFPIEDEDRFRATLGEFINQVAQISAQTDTATIAPWHIAAGTQNCRVVTQEECDTIHTRLLALDKARQEEAASIPSEEAVYKAQQLLLLTEISNGLTELKDSDTTV